MPFVNKPMCQTCQKYVQNSVDRYYVKCDKTCRIYTIRVDELKLMYKFYYELEDEKKAKFIELIKILQNTIK